MKLFKVIKARLKTVFSGLVGRLVRGEPWSINEKNAREYSIRKYKQNLEIIKRKGK